MKTLIIWAGIAVFSAMPLVAQQAGSTSQSSAPDMAAMQQAIGAVPGVGIRHLASWLVKTCRMSGRENGRLLQ